MTTPANTQTRELLSPNLTSKGFVANFIEGKKQQYMDFSMPAASGVDFLYPTSTRIYAYTNAENNLPLVLARSSSTSTMHYDDKYNFISQKIPAGKLQEITNVYMRIYKIIGSLTESLNELEELDNYATEEELSPPSPIAKELAKKILKKITLELPRDYSVSLWEDGDVVIYTAGAGWRVSVFCRTNGGASLYVNSPNENDHEEHYQSAQNMHIGSIIAALNNIPA